MKNTLKALLMVLIALAVATGCSQTPAPTGPDQEYRENPKDKQFRDRDEDHYTIIDGGE
jgi:hypothetical protein